MKNTQNINREELSPTGYQVYLYLIRHRSRFVTGNEVAKALGLNSGTSASYHLQKLVSNGYAINSIQSIGNKTEVYKLSHIVKTGPLKKYFFIYNRPVPKMVPILLLMMFPILLYFLFPLPTVVPTLSVIGLLLGAWELYVEMVEDTTFKTVLNKKA